jgi:hypothetical protein
MPPASPTFDLGRSRPAARWRRRCAFGTRAAGVSGAAGTHPRPHRARQLVTLQDAADYILKLPKAQQKLEEWQAATVALIMAAEGRGPLMHARIGMLRALNRHVERVFNSDRKDTHWRKRKLKRDDPIWSALC